MERTPEVKSDGSSRRFGAAVLLIAIGVFLTVATLLDGPIMLGAERDRSHPLNEQGVRDAEIAARKAEQQALAAYDTELALRTGVTAVEADSMRRKAEASARVPEARTELEFRRKILATAQGGDSEHRSWSRALEAATGSVVMVLGLLMLVRTCAMRPRS